LLVRVNEHRRVDAIFLLDGTLLVGGIQGDAEDRYVEVLERRVVFQINDLLQARRSTRRHVEEQQHGLALVIGQRNGVACGGQQGKIRGRFAHGQAREIGVIYDRGSLLSRWRGRVLGIVVAVPAACRQHERNQRHEYECHGEPATDSGACHGYSLLAVLVSMLSSSIVLNA
jgi:hypothetical protein